DRLGHPDAAVGDQVLTLRTADAAEPLPQRVDRPPACALAEPVPEVRVGTVEVPGRGFSQRLVRGLFGHVLGSPVFGTEPPRPVVAATVREGPPSLHPVRLGAHGNSRVGYIRLFAQLPIILLPAARAVKPRRACRENTNAARA